MVTIGGRARASFPHRRRAVLALTLAFAALWASLVPTATPVAAQSAGDFNLLDILNKLSSQSVQQAMASYPVPFALITRSTSKGGMNCPAAGTVVELITVYRAGSPKRVDTDTCGATGVGGNDIEITVEQLLGPPFALRLTINRLTPTAGLSATAADLTAVVAFPADAFNAETLAAPPYIYWGYSTR